jgi:peptidoglycan/LPS O-acetylase OafA/YrhL
LGISGEFGVTERVVGAIVIAVITLIIIIAIIVFLAQLIAPIFVGVFIITVIIGAGILIYARLKIKEAYKNKIKLKTVYTYSIKCMKL